MKCGVVGIGAPGRILESGASSARSRASFQAAAQPAELRRHCAISSSNGRCILEPTPRDRTWDLLLTRQALSPTELCGQECISSDRDSIKYQCDNLGDVTRSVTPPIIDNSCWLQQTITLQPAAGHQIEHFRLLRSRRFWDGFPCCRRLSIPAGTQTRA